MESLGDDTTLMAIATIVAVVAMFLLVIFVIIERQPDNDLAGEAFLSGTYTCYDGACYAVEDYHDDQSDGAVEHSRVDKVRT
ncbi:MAG: hypothetical protein ABIE94_01670 [archaeon]